MLQNDSKPTNWHHEECSKTPKHMLTDEPSDVTPPPPPPSVSVFVRLAYFSRDHSRSGHFP